MWIIWHVVDSVVSFSNVFCFVCNVSRFLLCFFELFSSFLQNVVFACSQFWSQLFRNWFTKRIRIYRVRLTLQIRFDWLDAACGTSKIGTITRSFHHDLVLKVFRVPDSTSNSVAKTLNLETLYSMQVGPCSAYSLLGLVFAEKSLARLRSLSKDGRTQYVAQ